jgi:hypothetical protein
VEFRLPFQNNGKLVDVLNSGESFPVSNGRVSITNLWPRWARVMKAE